MGIGAVTTAMPLDFDALAGIHCPIITPFDADGSVDRDSLRAVIDHALAGGVDGIVPCGTTGEFASLTPDERLAVIEATIEHVGDSGLVIAGVSGTAIPTVLDTIEDAAAAGADGALLTTAYFHAANAPRGERRFLESVADDTPIPIVLYNIPACTGRPIPVSTVAGLADHDRVIGIKDSSGDANYLSEVIRRTGPDFAVLQGFDSLLGAAMAMGAAGGINALSGVIPDAFAELHTAVTGGSMADARAIQRDRIAPLFQDCLEDGFAPVVKRELAAEGIIDDAAVRPPLVADSG